MANDFPPLSSLTGTNLDSAYSGGRYTPHVSKETGRGSDPTLSYTRNGLLQYQLYLDARQWSIQSTGDIPHNFRRWDGGENFWRSMVFHNEEVGHINLPPKPPAVPGEIWDFAGPNGFSVEVNSAIVAGGEMKDQGATKASANFRMISSTSFVFGADADPVRHFLFYGGPCDTHPPTVLPQAKRLRAQCHIAVIQQSNNRSLHDFRLPPELYNDGQIRFLPIQKMLREMYHNVPLLGETIRVEYRMTGFGESAGRAESQCVIVGAIYGFAVLPLIRK